MTTTTSAPERRTAFGACGGLELDGEAGRAFARLAVPALGRATVEAARLDAPTGRVAWEVEIPDPAGAAATQRQRLWADADRRVLELGGRPILELDLANRTIRHADGPQPVVTQAIAAVAMPLLVGELGSHVFHGSAAVISGKATLLLGSSGAGKSSLLVALARAGHAPLTEDACVVTPGPQAQIWPGPPWVRLAIDATAPDGWSRAFEGPDKHGWCLPGQPDAPQPVGRVVLLEPPRSGPPMWEQLPTAQAIPALAQHVTWLGDASDRLAGAFTAAVRLARVASVHTLRLEHRSDWLDVAVAALTS